MSPTRTLRSPQDRAPARPASPNAPPRRTPGRDAAATRGSANGASRAPAAAGTDQQPQHKILFQTFFKGAGERTYAAQVKQSVRGNPFLVLTEGRRDQASGEVRKSRILVLSDDLVALFRMLHETAQYLRAHPVQRRAARNDAPPAQPVPAARPPAAAQQATASQPNRPPPARPSGRLRPPARRP